jgi:putative ABC transport system substrate-binding protein
MDIRRIKRRDFIAGLADVTAWPLVARGEQAQSFHPSAPISDLTENSSSQAYRAFLGEFRPLGYAEGQNLILDRYSGEGQPERYEELAS